MTTEDLTDRVNRLIAKRRVLQDELKSKKADLAKQQQRLKDWKDTKLLLMEYIKQKHSRLRVRISKIITLALRAVYGGSAGFELIIDHVGNRTETRSIVMGGGYEYDPKNAKGGGVRDILGLAARVVFGRAERPKRRPTSILDEPIKWVGRGEKLDRACEMIQAVPDELDTQLIILTHEPKIAALADRIYQVEHDGTKASVELIKDGPIVGTKRKWKVKFKS